MNARTARLGDICEIVSGATPKTEITRFWGGDVPWTTPKDLSELETPYLDRPARTITEEGLNSCSARMLPANSVLLSSRAPIGLVAINTVPMATNQGFKSLVPSPNRLDSKFLYYWLKSKTDFLQSLGNGATFKEISKAIVERIEIPLPPRDEQRRIAAILDRADALRRKRKRIVELIRDVPQSLFNQMFGDPQANPGRWNRTSALLEVAEIGSGITKGRKAPSAPLRTVPYLAVANVQDRSLALATMKTIEASEEEIFRFRLRTGDLVLTEGGDPDKLGRGTVWRDELPEVIHQNHIFRVRVDPNELDPLYLNFLVGSPYGKNYFLRSAKQTTGIASINKSQLSRFPVLLPPLDLQQQFASEVGRLAGVRNRALQAEKGVLDLFASLQHRAFSGQL